MVSRGGDSRFFASKETDVSALAQNVKFTLYEILGYLFPGFITLSAVAILYSALFLSDYPFSPYKQEPEVWTAGLLLAYFAGHVTQGLTNLLAGIPWLKLSDDAFVAAASDGALGLARRKARKLLQLRPVPADGEDVAGPLVFSLCDQAMAQSANPGDRELYQYREGFYRGSSMALVLLSMALLATAFLPHRPSALLGGITYVPEPLEYAVLAVLSFLAAIPMFLRLKRFAEYRVRRAILSFILPVAAASGDE